jgi:hypothetical protein
VFCGLETLAARELFLSLSARSDAGRFRFVGGRAAALGSRIVLVARAGAVVARGRSWVG